MKKRLIVCVDGSSYGVEACRYACWLAGRTDSTIRALYVSDLRQFEVPVVADISGSFAFQPYQGVSSRLQEIENERAEAIKEATLATFEAEGMRNVSTFEHKTGLLVDVLKELQGKDEWIVLGKRGETANFASEHLGSMMERVIFAYDGGESCRKALRYIAESSFMKELELHVVTVSEGKDKNQRREDLMEAEKTLRNAGLKPVCQMLTGDPEGSIAGYVTEKEMNMLIMGAYGHNRIRYLLIGSTTTEMIRRCQIPVMCFR